ncbi:MAG: hypothetical protein SPL08_04780 [Pseudomonadota bacterium]|nr:hypothetical protein [Pseudomonadota bacterium]
MPVSEIAILSYIQSVLTSAYALKKLVIIPSDPIGAYERKGQRDMLRDYYNPRRFFDIVFCLSPHEQGIRFQYGMHIIGVTDSVFQNALRLIKPNAIRCYGDYQLNWVYANRPDPSVPIIVSIHARGTDERIQKADYVFCVTQTCATDISKFLPHHRIFVYADRVNRQIFYPNPPPPRGCFH